MTGASTAALLAGCGGPGDDGTEEPAPEEDPGAPEEDPGAPAEEDPAEEEEDPAVDNDEAEDEEEEDEDDEDDENEENEENDENNDNDNDDWEDVDEILLEGYTPGWEGVEPEMIEGEENPTLELIEGEEYEITWENADGDLHNIEIWDEDDEVVDDYETEIMDDEGETQTLEFEATDEMVAYVCEVHIGTMLGDIEVESE